MKKIFILYLIFLSFNCFIYSQYSLPYDEINKTHIEKGNEGIMGPQCVGGLVYDDNTWENGYGWGPNFGIGKWVMLMTPTSYPFTINQVCLALTRYPTQPSLNFTFDIEIYDQTGTGGSPGNLLASVPNQTVTVVPTWPQVEWYDFTNLTGIPAITSGSVYVGISFDPQPPENRQKFIGADESATTTQRPGYGYILSAWAPIATNYFPLYKALGVRADGTTQTYIHNIGVGPFLSLPGVYDQNTMVIKAKVSNLGTSNETGIPISFAVNGTQISTISMDLNAGAVDSVAFNWTPTDTGAQILKVISSLASDQYRTDDTVTAAVYVNSDQCSGGLVYDDNTFEGGCGWISGYYQTYKWVMLFTPQSYPYSINQMCIALTKGSSGSGDWTFDIVVYDNTGPGGSPGNLLATIPNQTAVGVQPWPTVTWYNFAGITGIPAITSGSVYVGISYNIDNYTTWLLIGDDQSTSTPLRAGYFYSSTVSTWTPIQNTVFSAYRALGIRCSSTFSVSGTVLYNDDNQPVTSGVVKAIRYDSLLNKVNVIDSGQIQSNGTYIINNLPPLPMDFMAFEDDELDYAPTYYDTTIYWQHAITLIPTTNLNNIDIKVKRINNSDNGIRHISGTITTGNDLVGLSDAVVYAKIGSLFKNYDISRANGYFYVDSLQDGSYTLVVDRMGYLPYTINVNLSGSSIENLNINMIYIMGISNINKEIPLRYLLSQNYPNPFNPVTNILFDIIKQENVKLTIFSLLGEEIKVLVNEKLDAGEYKVSFDASGFASGVYFYKLETENFVESKKMVLLK